MQFPWLQPKSTSYGNALWNSFGPVHLLISQQNARDRRNALGTTFGTKKSKAAIADQTRNSIHIQGSTSNLNAASQAVLDSMAEATSKMSTRDQLQVMADDGKPRPKANLEATRLADAYPINTLFDLSAIPVKEWHDNLKANKDIRTSSRFVSSRLKKVILADNNIDAQKLKVLRYLLCLLDLNNSTTQKGKTRMLPDKSKLLEKLRLPLPVVESVRRKFSEGGVMTKHHGDLLITTICVLALIVDNFEIDSTMPLREDLKLDTKPMNNYFLEVGAKVAAPPASFVKERGLSKAESKQHNSAKLKLPLVFPKVRVPRSRKK